MFYKVIVKPANLSFTVKEHETVLEAAVRNGIYFPHHCCMGVCASCKGKLLQGKIEYVDEEIFGLTVEEKENGHVLFCSATPKTDLMIEVQDVQQLKQFYQYDVIEKEKLTNDISRFILKPRQNFIEYEAGQYIKVFHDKENFSYMSIACAPNEMHLIELHLFHPAKNHQAQDILQLIEKNKFLNISGPFGNCVPTRFDKNKAIIFYGKDTAFAPIKSVIEELLRMNWKTPIYFYWGGENYLSSSFCHANPCLEHAGVNSTWHPLPLSCQHASSWHPENIKYIKLDPNKDLIQTILTDFKDLTDYQIYAVDTYHAVHEALQTFMQKGLKKELFYSDLL